MKNPLSNFRKSEGGNFAITMGLALTPLMMTVGAAVDYSGFKRLENRMIISAETAMLAASKHIVKLREQDYADNGDYDMSNAEIVAELDTVFKPFFEANFAAGGYDLQENQYTLEYIEADNNTKVRITMNYDTAVMKIAGHHTLTATKDMIINLKVQPKNYVIDIVMCIDATGSMQNTLNSVQANAKTFNRDLREELGVGEASEKLKIRTRPIFYRDWEEGRDYRDAVENYTDTYGDILNEFGEIDPDALGGGSGGFDWDGFREEMEDEWNDSSWYYQNWRGRWRRSNRRWKPKTHKRVRFSNLSGYHYFTSIDELNDFIDDLEDGSVTVAGFDPSGTGTGTPPPPPVNHGLNMYKDFIDLDPHSEEAEDREDRNTELETFLSSTHAFGGHDWPEAAGACLNEAIRSYWFDNQSQAARDYFKVPAGHVIIDENDDIPNQTYTKITTIPVVVFWSDATINSYQKSRDYLSPTTPTSNLTFESLWNGTLPSGDPQTRYMQDTGKPVIDPDYRMMIRFGPAGASGFNTWETWDKVHYGGSLSTGNSEAVKVIAEKILESIPDLLRVGS